jgi:hypothetical protein
MSTWTVNCLLPLSQPHVHLGGTVVTINCIQIACPSTCGTHKTEMKLLQ